MKLQRGASLFAVAVLALGVAACSPTADTSKTASTAPAVPVESFLGRWDLTLKAPDKEYPSWLELTQENGQLKAVMVGRWGNARPLPKVEITNGQLKFVSPKEEEGAKSDMVFNGTLTGSTLSGTGYGAGRHYDVDVDRREGAIIEGKRHAKMGQAHRAIQRKRFVRMDHEQVRRQDRVGKWRTAIWLRPEKAPN